MPTRTAPTVDGSVSFKRVSMSFVDAESDERSISIIADPTTTNAEIESLAAAIQAATNSSLFEINVTEVYSGARNSTNADNAARVSVFDNHVYHVKQSPTDSQRGYIPAPLSSTFVTGTDTPDTADALLTAWFSAVLAVVKGTYAGVSVRFTERREINDAVKF